jgi:hypothetical protein
MAANGSGDKSLEAWIWDAACSIRGSKDAPKYKEYILPLIFAKRLCDFFDDELNRIAKEVGSRAKAFTNEFVIKGLSAGVRTTGKPFRSRSMVFCPATTPSSPWAASPALASSTRPNRSAWSWRILDPEPGLTVYDPCCGSAGLLIKCQLVLEEKMILRSRKNYAPLPALRPRNTRPRPGRWPT